MTGLRKSPPTSGRKEYRAVLKRRLGIPANMAETICQAVCDSGLSYEAYVRTITSSALKELTTWNQSDLERLLGAARTHGLNPLNREIFMIANATDAPPLIAVGVDGWAKIMNAHPQFAGMMFSESTEQANGIPLWIECEIHRHDRVVPLKVREYFEESRSEHLAWLTHPRRMLRHKCMVQCARLAFGLSGIYDTDEALRIRESGSRPNFSKPHKEHPQGMSELKKGIGRLNEGAPSH